MDSPPAGWYKLNTDGSFVANGTAGAGMVLRDHLGKIVFTSCRNLYACPDALETELMAAMEGIALALQWCDMPFIVEVDCLELVNMVQKQSIDLSAHMTVIEDNKNSLKARQTCITHVNRKQNSISHFMANYARSSGRTAVWLNSGPEHIEDRCIVDCKPFD